MNPERFQRIQDLFDRARELGEVERAAFLDEACGGDASLREEAQRLLDVDAHHANGALGRALSDEGPRSRGLARRLPSEVAGYRILGQCGSGGMGVVYRAQKGESQRTVALKVIRGGSFRPEARKRFQRESSILERLRHPGIARIFESGEFREGGVESPFIAMEFVDGPPLLQYAEGRRMDRRGRVELMVQVCEAIHYAHTQGVVHRDLKPDNVLVAEAQVGAGTGVQPRPKVLDFGIARLADSETGLTHSTGTGQLLGSVPYMSPEQVSGDSSAIDARTDVYSLGVVLFELLAGRLPHSVQGRPIADALYTIYNEPPSRLGSADPALRGDLEVIVGKCLERDPSRRYSTAQELAEDLGRHLAARPITAQPPSTWYQFRSFASRNRALVGGTVATLLALLIGALLAVGFALRANQNARDAAASQTRSDRNAARADLGAASALMEVDPVQARAILEGIPEERRGWEWRHLSCALSGLLLEFGEVAPRLSSFRGVDADEMAVLPGGEHVLGLSGPSTFTVWNARRGQVVRTFPAPSEVALFAVSGNGERIAAGLTDGSVVSADLAADAPSWEGEWTSDVPVESLELDEAGGALALRTSAELRVGRRGAWREIPVPADADPVRQRDLAFGPGGRRLASTWGDLNLYDRAASLGVLHSIPSAQGHGPIAFTPDGQRVVVGQAGREVRVYDVETGELIQELLGHQYPVRHVAVSAGGRLATRDSRTVRVWDLASGDTLAIFDAAGTSQVEFLDEDHLLTLTGGRFRLWTLSGARSRQLVGHGDHVWGATFHGSGELLATVAPWGQTIIWDVAAGEPLFRTPSYIRNMAAFGQEGASLLLSSAGRYSQSLLWPTGSQEYQAVTSPERGLQLTASLPEVVRVGHRPGALGGKEPGAYRIEHERGAASTATRLFKNGAAVALGDAESSFELGPHPLLRLGDWRAWGYSGHVYDVLVFEGTLSRRDTSAVEAYLQARLAGLHPPLPELSAAGERARLAHFQANEQTVERDSEGHVLSWGAIHDPQLRLRAHGSPALGVRFVVADDSGPARVRIAADWILHRWLELPLPQLAERASVTLFWLGDWRTLKEAPVRAVSVLTPPAFAELERDPRVTKVGAEYAYSPDGRYLAEGSHARGYPSSVTVRDARTGYGLVCFEGDYHGLSFAPDSVHLAVGQTDGRIEVFHVPSGERVHAFEAHGASVYDVAYSPDGARLASGGNDNALRLWDTEHWELKLELPGHRSYVRGVAWSPDGTRLVSACGDHTVRIWDAVPKRERHQQRLARAEWMAEVRPEVEGWLAREEPEAALARASARWAQDEGRRLAAFKVVARWQSEAGR